MRSTHLLFIILALILISIPETAHAQALFDSGTNFLTALQNLLTNTWARIIAIIAVIGPWDTLDDRQISLGCGRFNNWRHYPCIWRACYC